MNPELPQVRSSSEAMPQIPGSAEFFPDGTVQTVETVTPQIEQGSMQTAQVEQLSQSAQAAAPMPVSSPYVSLQQSSGGAADQTSPLADATTTPSLAADDDLIEKEWVDKVKKIIALTKGKPYEQAQAVAALQADYLKKRYNRVLGESDGQ